MGEVGGIDFEKLKSLIEINARINGSYSRTDALLTSILESAMCLVECESASVLLLNKEDASLRFMIALGPKGADAKDIKVSRNSIAGWVAAHNEPLILNDVMHDSRFFPDVQNKTNYISRNMIAFPMRVKEECVGVIELINKSRNQPFDEKDLSILSVLGDLAGSAYNNAAMFQSNKDRINVLQNAVNVGKDYHAFVAKSPVILDLMDVIGRVAKTKSSVLIIGESGVGKELFAEQLHLHSDRTGKPFIRVSCAALSPTLLESELFGHVKGAYTSAVTAEKGRFELADGGTLFLDEIGEMPLNLQAKLLRVLQERKFERVGSGSTISVDVRIIAATNRNLEAMVKEGTFRQDLYYRLNVMPLNIPPLRQRREDIEPLAQYFLQKYCEETKKSFEGFSAAATKMLYTYYWPGNVRELENTVERAVILGHDAWIQVQDLNLPVETSGGAVQPVIRGGAADAAVQMALEESVHADDRSLKAALNSFKRQYVTAVLEETGWNQTAAAKILDVQRTYVSKLLNELQIKNPVKA
ncbi:MAG: sigma 54-interacting transcriptional regulator [Treponema sp.]|jgi:Nif-specific regulatory protein|nr:sigma 54-interacting transcriptional regulator [Treponema sp.]